MARQRVEIPPVGSDQEDKNEKLPKSVQEIADVIGREKALRLVKCWRKHYSGGEGKKSYRTYIYIPRRIRREHPLVQILGFKYARRMVRHFGGEGLMVAGCSGNKGGRPKKKPCCGNARL